MKSQVTVLQTYGTDQRNKSTLWKTVIQKLEMVGQNKINILLSVQSKVTLICGPLLHLQSPILFVIIHLLLLLWDRLADCGRFLHDHEILFKGK